MSAIPDCKREPDDPDTVTERHLRATFPLVPDASDEIVAEGMAMIDLLRQLERHIQRMLIVAPRHAQDVADIGDAWAVQPAAPPTRPVVSAPKETGPLSTVACDELRRYVARQLRSSSTGGVYNTCMRALERLLFEEATRLAEGNQARAAKMLGLPRPTLHAKLAKHGLLKQDESRLPRKPR